MWNRSRNLWSVDPSIYIYRELCIVACAVEMNLAWNFTGKERLTLYYDSVEELGWLACSKCIFFSLRVGVTLEPSM